MDRRLTGFEPRLNLLRVFGTTLEHGNTQPGTLTDGTEHRVATGAVLPTFVRRKRLPGPARVATIPT